MRKILALALLMSGTAAAAQSYDNSVVSVEEATRAAIAYANARLDSGEPGSYEEAEALLPKASARAGGTTRSDESADAIKARANVALAAAPMTAEEQAFETAAAALEAAADAKAIEAAAAAVEDARRRLEGSRRYAALGRFGSGDYEKYGYADQQSVITTQPGYRRGWTTLVFRGPKGHAPSAIEVFRVLLEIDCAGKRHRVLSSLAYERSGKISQHTPREDWDYTVPDTAIDWATQAYCVKEPNFRRVNDPLADAKFLFKLTAP